MALRRTSQSIWQLLLAAALIALAGIVLLSAVIWLSARAQDRLAIESSQDLVRINLDERVEDLGRNNRYDAWSDEVFRQVTGSIDPAWKRGRFGNKLFQVHDVHAVFVLDATDRTILASPFSTRSSNDAFVALSSGLSTLLNETRRRSGFRPVTSLGFLMFRGLPAIVAATVVTPEEGSRLWLGAEPKHVLVYVRQMDRRFLERLAERVQIEEIIFRDEERPARRAFLPLNNPLGHEFLALTWSLPLPGRSVLQRMSSVFGIAIVVLSGLFWIFLRRAKRIGEELSRQARILDQIQDAVITCDLKGIITQWNGGAERMFGYSAEEAIGRNLSFIDPTNMYGATEEQALAMDLRTGHFEVEGIARRKNGEDFPIHLSLSPASTWKGARAGTVGYVLDITKRKQLEAQLEQLATVDALTGARNRHYFAEQAPAEIERARRFQHPLSFLFLDLDHFKRINDHYGHKFGDVVLTTIGKLCRRLLRRSDIFVRYGGEEFVILLPETDVEGARVIAARIADQIRKTEFSHDPPVRGLTVSIGVSALRGPDDTLEGILQRIDKAVYRAKALGRDRIELMP